MPAAWGLKKRSMKQILATNNIAYECTLNGGMRWEREKCNKILEAFGLLTWKREVWSKY